MKIRSDLKILTLVTVYTLVIWYLLSDYSISDFIGRNDATSGLIWVLQSLRDHTLNELAYLPGVLGGYSLTHAIGTLWPILPVLKLTPLSVFAVHNLLVIFCQVLSSYFAIKWITDSREEKLQYFGSLAVVCLVGFAPVLGIRIGYGHMNFILGGATFIGLLYYLKAVENRATTNLDTLLLFLILSLTINFVSFQPLVIIAYTLPVVLLSTWGVKRLFEILIDKRIILFILTFVAINFYFTYPFFRYYLEGSAARSGAIDIFSYAPPHWKSLLASLLWENTILNLAPEKFKWHELHFPFGVTIAAVFLTTQKKKILLICGTLVILVLFLLQAPVITDLVTALPLLGKFRVPQRILFFVSLLCTLHFARYLFALIPGRPSDKVGVTIISVLSAIVLTRYSQGYLDLLMILAFLMIIISRKLEKRMVVFFSIILLSFTSVQAFFTQFQPKLKIEQLNTYLNERKAFSFPNPYERSFVMFSIQETHFNTSFALNIPAVNGYFYAPARFSQLIHEIRGFPFDPTFLTWAATPDEPQAKLIAQLYNIRQIIKFENGIDISDYEVGHDGIIFPMDVTYTNDLNLIVENLKSNFRHAHLAEIETQELEGCREGEVQSQFLDGRLRIHGNTIRRCLIILPTNFSESVSVTGEGIEKTLPANHALMGVILKAGKISGIVEGNYF